MPKIPVLRRSESERLASTISISPPKFLDTMALRPKTKHGHTSQVFLEFVAEKESLTQQKCDDAEDPIKTNINNIQETVSKTDNDIGNLSDSSEITSNVLKNLRHGITGSPEPPPRLKSKSKKHNYVKTRFVRTNSSSSTSDEWSDTNENEQKTVLRVKQFDSDESEEQKDKKEMYKAMDIEPRKTSIQINGNECYSTMNVRGDTPIYLSSVVVNEDYSNTCNTFQTGTTVTISVGSPQTELKQAKSQIYIGAEFTGHKDNTEEFNTYEDYCTDAYKNFDKNDISFILNDPVEAVRRNLIPHVCGKKDDVKRTNFVGDQRNLQDENKPIESGNYITKLFDDPFFSHLAEGLDSNLVKKLIENSLIKLQETKHQEGTESSKATIEKLIESSLISLKEEVKKENIQNENKTKNLEEKNTGHENNGCLEHDDKGCSAPYESMEYESGAMGVFSDFEPMSDCYNASTSELSTEDDNNSTRSKFYQMLVDAAICDIEITNNTDDDHLYESIRLNSDPIYEEIGDMPPPLPVNPPPNSLSLLDDEKRSGSRSIFEGASKYDILSYLVDAKERGIDDEETYITNYANENDNSSLLDESKEKSEVLKSKLISSNTSQLSNASDSSEDNSLVINQDCTEKAVVCKKPSAEIERNDSGVGSETSKSSRSRFQGKIMQSSIISDKDAPIHLCEDCDTAVETQITEQGKIVVLFTYKIRNRCTSSKAKILCFAVSTYTIL